jgi:Suppressor of fused protein (SUFU)
MKTVNRYAAVLGRPPFVERKLNGSLNICAFGFPPLRRSFWRSLFSEAHDTTIYLTAGMSEHPMPVPHSEQKLFPPRVELMADCAGQITGGPLGNEDVVSAILLGIAEFTISSEIFIGIGHTLDYREPLAPNTNMSGFLFTPPVGIDEKRLCRCSKSESILNVVPITAAELSLARNSGVPALIDRLEASGFSPVFSYMRESAV